MSAVTHAGFSDRGRRRPHNEDRWLADPSLGLYAVADGVGGAGGGDLAAQVVAESLPALIRRHMRGLRDLAQPRAAERMAEAISGLNHAIRVESYKHPSLIGMGAAVVVALVWDNQALIAHLGDCRAYLLHDGALRLLTRDHSVVQRLLDQGALTPAEAVHHPDNGLLTRYAGLSEDAVPDVTVIDVAAGDRLLLCSDGLPAMLSDAEIQGILALALPLTVIAQLLIDTANLLGGEDNVTVALVAPSVTAAPNHRPQHREART